jgi:hypothetical protein
MAPQNGFLWRGPHFLAAQNQGMPKRLRFNRNTPNTTSAIYVGRPTKWGNPYKIGLRYTREQAVANYRRDLLTGKLPFTQQELVRELGGKDLLCWCAPGLDCHADILLAFANPDAPNHR